MDEQAEDPPLTVRVVGGGDPTDEELAAVLVALTPAAPDEPEQSSRTTAWTRAAMIEGVGGRPPTSPADLAVSAQRG